MKDILVHMAASSVQGTMPLYLVQLDRAGIDYHVEPLTLDMSAGGCLRDRIAGVRAACERFAEYRYLILCDAFDITFYGTRDDLLARLPKSGVLWAAEKNCYPDLSLAPSIPTPRPWAFANGGLSAGSPEAYLEWCNLAQSYDQNAIDQKALNEMLSKGQIVIDAHTELFFCLFGGYEELAFNGLPFNTLYQTSPLFVHANGKWPSEEFFRMVSL